MRSYNPRKKEEKKKRGGEGDKTPVRTAMFPLISVCTGVNAADPRRSTDKSWSSDASAA
jgi:hypothetical protein